MTLTLSQLHTGTKDDGSLTTHGNSVQSANLEKPVSENVDPFGGVIGKPVLSEASELVSSLTV